MQISNGYVVWEGISRLDLKTPIVAILTCLVNNSENPKTGNMAQLLFLPRDIHPKDARITGCDVSVCGSCVHRFLLDNT